MTTTRRELLRLGLGAQRSWPADRPYRPSWPAPRSPWPTSPKRDAAGRSSSSSSSMAATTASTPSSPTATTSITRAGPSSRLKAKDLKPIDDHVGLHPSLDGFAKLREEGRLAIVQSVGYPNPNRSHFESMAIWQTARLHPGQEEPGWLARAIDAGPAAAGRRRPGLAHRHARHLPQALRGGRSVRPLDGDGRPASPPHWACPNPTGPTSSAVLDRIASQCGTSENPLLQFVSRSTVISYASSARLDAVLRDGDSGRRRRTRTA